MKLRNKKILFIGTGFFDYEESIIKELKDRGALVYYFSTVFSTPYSWFLIRTRQEDKCVYAFSKRLTKLISVQPNDIDCIFIIKAENFLQCHMDLLKEKYPNTPIVLYLWDSLNRLPNRDVLLNNLKNIQTFDRKDANDYNLIFRPLFCRVIDDTNIPIKYDLSFVGSDHTIRYSLLKRIGSQLDDAGLSYKFVLRIGRLAYILKRNLSHNITNNTESWFVKNPIDYDEYLRISKQSNVILDIANPMQSGLTIRSIEAMGLGKKILTTNNDIINYNIDHNYYRILDNSLLRLDMDFIKDHRKIHYNLDNFRLEKFIDDIFANI